MSEGDLIFFYIYIYNLEIISLCLASYVGWGDICFFANFLPLNVLETILVPSATRFTLKETMFSSWIELEIDDVLVSL